MPNDGVQLIRFVADAAIVRERNPAAFADYLQPGGVRRIMREVIGMPLDRQPCRPENFGKALSQIAIGEIDKAQAARS